MMCIVCGGSERVAWAVWQVSLTIDIQERWIYATAEHKLPLSSVANSNVPFLIMSRPLHYLERMEPKS